MSTFDTVFKGDVEGHPFRGNQWSDGQGGGEESKPKDPANSREEIERHVSVAGPVDTPRKLVKFVEHLTAEKYDDITAAIDAHKEVARAAVQVHEGDAAKGIPTVWALGWEPGQGTDIHDHGESAAAVHAMRGTVGETVFHAPENYLDLAKGEGLPIREGTHALSKGGTMPVKGRYIHEMSGLKPGRSITLHAYWPPLKKMRYFQRKEGKLVYDGEWEEGKAPAAGEKTRKALCHVPVVYKGDYEGHPFRGNQYNEGEGEQPSQVSWEATPHPTSGRLPGIHRATYEQRAEYMRDVRDALHVGGRDVLADELGLKVSSDFEGPGLYMGEFNPGDQVEVIENLPDHVQADRVERYAAAMGKLLGQEGVAYHRPKFVEKLSEANANEIKLGNTISKAHMGKLYEGLKNALGDEADSIALVPSKAGVRALNFSSLPNEEFHRTLFKVAESHLPASVKFDMVPFGSTGDVISNDWRKHKNGEGYDARLARPGGPDVQGTMDRVLRPRLQAVDEKYARKYGWDKPDTPRRRREREEAAAWDPSAEDLIAKAMAAGAEGSGGVLVRPRKLSGRVKRKHWERLREKVFEPAEEVMRSSWKRALRYMRDETVTRVKNGARSVNATEWKKTVANMMRPAYRKVAAIAADHLGLKMLDEIVVKRRRQVALSFAPDRERVDRIVGTVEERLIRLLEEADAEDLDDDEVAQLADEEFDVWGESDTVPRSETSATVNRVRDDIFEADVNDWVTAGDHRVRDTHVVYGEAGPHKAGFNWATLSGGNHTLRFPHDPECEEPSDVINCRCVLLPSGAEPLDEDEE